MLAQAHPDRRQPIPRHEAPIGTPPAARHRRGWRRRRHSSAQEQGRPPRGHSLRSGACPRFERTGRQSSGQDLTTFPRAARRRARRPRRYTVVVSEIFERHAHASNPECADSVPHVDTISHLDAVLSRGRPNELRRLDQLRTADRLRHEAVGAAGDRRTALIEAAQRLEARAGPPL